MQNPVDAFMQDLQRRNPAQPEFLQAAQEVVSSVRPVLEARPA